MEAPNPRVTMDDPTEPSDRVRAFGNQLVDVHLWLRDQLDQLRDDVDAFLDDPGPDPASQPSRPSRDLPNVRNLRDLRAHCLTFCSALTRHHTGEDTGPFPVLAAEVPELRPVIDELVRDHRLVTDALRRVEEVLDSLGRMPEHDEARRRRVRGELDTLAALLETHFSYEERRLVSALNDLGALSPDGSRPDFLLTAAELDS
ncbi:hemerythrin domain-containing protein [Actinopolymorpha pittospori]|nr:hemerythrin domain-containing protein [Actinopolymorpha pittospori]